MRKIKKEKKERIRRSKKIRQALETRNRKMTYKDAVKKSFIDTKNFFLYIRDKTKSFLNFSFYKKKK